MTAGETRNDMSGLVIGAVVQGREVTVQVPASVPAALSGLPPSSATFTGRESELQTVASWLRPGSSVSRWGVVAGLAGVGKTELSIQAARAGLAAGWFPGGVLFVDLYGYDEARRPDLGVVLDGLLRALGVSAESVPPDAQDRARLYRSVLRGLAESGRQVLLIFDNTSSAAQLRPLLPGVRDAAVIITSRDTLATLSTELGANRLDLDILEPRSSYELLASAAGSGRSRLDDDPDAAFEIARLCGHLPLAMQIVAALLVENPNRSIRVVADDLADDRTRLDELDHPDKAVRASFDLSYRCLDPEQARMLRLLGLNAGPDVSTEAAAELAGKDRRAVRRFLRALARAHLVELGAADDRWRLHDLVRIYARERAHSDDSRAHRNDAVARLLCYYAEKADAAGTFVGIGKGENGQCQFANRSSALTWLTEERRNLIAMLELDDETVRLDLVVRLSANLAGFSLWHGDETESRCMAKKGIRAARRIQERQGDSQAHEREIASLDFVLALHALGLVMTAAQQFNEIAFVYPLAADFAQRIADPTLMKLVMSSWTEAAAHAGLVDEAQRVYGIISELYKTIGDRVGEGEALSLLGNALCRSGHTDNAIHALQEAINIFQETGSQSHERTVLTILGNLMEKKERLGEAVDHLRRAEEISRRLDESAKGRLVSRDLGRVLQKAGRHEEAIDAYLRAAELCKRLSDPFGRGVALFDLGHMLHGLSRFDDATDIYRQCADAFREAGRAYDEARAHANLCIALAEMGRYTEARPHGEQAVTLFSEAGTKGDVERAHSLLKYILKAIKGNMHGC